MRSRRPSAAVHQGLGLTVFHEGRRGSASTAGLDRAAVERLVEEAMLIARTRPAPIPTPICPRRKAWPLRGPCRRFTPTARVARRRFLEAAITLDRVANGIAASDSPVARGRVGGGWRPRGCGPWRPATAFAAA
ncbi:PmbA/TldA family metallopeptidase [Caulobacter segnis]